MKSKKSQFLSPILKLFMTAMVLANIASTMTLGFLSLYLINLGASVTDVGLVFTISSIVPVALKIVGGWISDRIGRLKAIAWGSLAGVIASFGFWLAPDWESITIFLGISYIAVSMVSPSFSSFIADQTPEEDLGKVFGITDAIYNLIGVFGPLIGGYIALNYNYKSLYLVALILYSLAAILRIWMAYSDKINPETESKDLTFSSFKKNINTMIKLLISGGVITWIFISDGISDVSGRLSGSLSPIYQETIGGLTLLEIGYLASIMAITQVIFTAPGGWVADKYGERFGISVGFILSAIGILIFLPAQTFSQYAISEIVFGLSSSLLAPAYQSMISKAFPKNMRGTAFGFFQSTLGIISLPAPWIGAQMWELINPQSPFLITAFSIIIISFIVWFKFHLPKNISSE